MSLLIYVISGKIYTALQSNYAYPVDTHSLRLTTHSPISLLFPVTTTASLLVVLLPLNQLGTSRYQLKDSASWHFSRGTDLFGSHMLWCSTMCCWWISLLAQHVRRTTWPLFKCDHTSNPSHHFASAAPLVISQIWPQEIFHSMYSCAQTVAYLGRILKIF